MLWLGRPGKLLLPGPFLLGPASASCRGFVLNAWSLLGPKGNRGDPWRSPGKPCRTVLRLPVHKSGVLRYPYFSTPTSMNIFIDQTTMLRIQLISYAIPFVQRYVT